MISYVIIDASEVANVDFDQVAERSVETLRFSLDGSKTFVKFEGDTPDFLISEPQYTQEEILAILSGAEWTATE